MPDLTDAARRDLAPMICAPSDKTCDRSASYIARAHQAFDAAARAEEARHSVTWEGSGSIYVAVSQSMCTRDIHYQFADEVCAYDLATGAA